jgi:hypothetical protein
MARDPVIRKPRYRRGQILASVVKSLKARKGKESKP